ncbi:MAG: hypothetical protein WBP79_13610 [Candidatus Acidiferrales bacterium]
MSDGAAQFAAPEFAARPARRTNRCVAFDHSPRHNELWTPCTRRVVLGGRLCRTHRDALDGVIYGLAQAGEVDSPRYGENPTIEEALIAFAEGLLAATEPDLTQDVAAPFEAATVEEEKSAAPIVAAPADEIGRCDAPRGSG